MTKHEILIAGQESPLQDIAKLLQDVRHQWFLTQTTIPESRRARAVSILAMYYEKVKAAYCDYAFWDMVPLFEYFCLARILPYMTTEAEKKCILTGLERIYYGMFSGEDISVPANLPKTPTLSVDLDTPFVGQDRRVTVIIPALGRAMEEVYSSGSTKLLTLNVRCPFCPPDFDVNSSLGKWKANHCQQYRQSRHQKCLAHCSSSAQIPRRGIIWLHDCF
jgi:hypothetical protein